MPSATHVDGPKAIVLTDEERDGGAMSDMKLYEAIEAFFTDGLVVIENAIDTAIIDKLNERMLQDTEKLLSGNGEVHFKQVFEVLSSHGEYKLMEDSHLNVNATTKGAAAGGNLSQVPPLEKGIHIQLLKNTSLHN